MVFTDRSKDVYYFSCLYCMWDSRSLDIAGESLGELMSESLLDICCLCFSAHSHLPHSVQLILGPHHIVDANARERGQPIKEQFQTILSRLRASSPAAALGTSADTAASASASAIRRGGSVSVAARRVNSIGDDGCSSGGRSGSSSSDRSGDEGSTKWLLSDAEAERARRDSARAEVRRLLMAYAAAIATD
jgi:hypothetical protein